MVWISLSFASLSSLCCLPNHQILVFYIKLVTFIFNNRNYLKLTDIKDWEAKTLKDVLPPQQEHKERQRTQSCTFWLTVIPPFVRLLTPDFVAKRMFYMGFLLHKEHNFFFLFFCFFFCTYIHSACGCLSAQSLQKWYNTFFIVVKVVPHRPLYQDWHLIRLPTSSAADPGSHLLCKARFTASICHPHPPTEASLTHSAALLQFLNLHFLPLPFLSQRNLTLYSKTFAVTKWSEGMYTCKVCL